MSHGTRDNKVRAAKRAPVVTTDPTGLASFAAELRPHVAALRAAMLDATARPSQRQRARVALRKDMLRSLGVLEARLDVAEHADDAGLGCAGPVA
jgi:hypothetical protein